MPLMQDPPARVKVRTNVTGSLSTFAVDETSISPGYRSFTQAVLDGDLVSGTDIFPVIVIDTTVTNGPKLFQIVTATWNNTTKQLTVVQSYQPAGPPSWGTGWRDVVVINLPALFMFTTGGTMTGLVHLLLSGAAISPNANTAFVAQKSATSGTAAYGSIVAGNAAVAGLNLGNTANELAAGVWHDNNTGTLYLRTAATNGPRVDSSGVLRNASGVAYLTSVGAAFPAGTILQFGGAPPLGWTRNDETEQVIPMIARAADTPGALGGDWQMSGLSVVGTTDGYSLTEANLATHDHPLTYFVIGAGSVSGPAWTTTGGLSGVNANTGDAGSGTAHSHGLGSASIDSDSTWRPRYRVWVKATKDA